MNKATVEYIQLVYFYRLILIRYIYLSNLTSLLAENEFEEDPSLGETREVENPAKEKLDVLEKGAGLLLLEERYFHVFKDRTGVLLMKYRKFSDDNYFINDYDAKEYIRKLENK